ncbi:Cadherin-like and PC-esterase domain containing protein 1 [Dissostichus eleginoides]|uniref:Cadherin-like and PC-esterase domain containing protein 1 n=1 Tax=Dissostichus eleginoides TaxID=100907 RepID=A0AAD9B1R2_DISEL|nr:Cadherin-like and PC-esterase domain containing protein 1 [Dissostichus eleginoides]
MVNVYVLVTSVKPLTSFLHDLSVVTNQEQQGRPTQLAHFLQHTLGAHSSHDALRQIKRVIGEVLLAAVSTNQEQTSSSGSITPVVVQVDTDLTFSALSEEAFEGPISRDRILEDTLHFLHLSSAETQFQRQMKTPSAFQLPLSEEYRAEVTFDLLTVRVRPEPMSSACRAHLDQHLGPSMAVFPLALGDSSIIILVTGGEEPVVMATYSVQVTRDSRPSLPMFGDHVTCSFLQSSALHQDAQPPPHLQLRTPSRTCDWREVTWQPDGCYHPQVSPPLLQACLTERKVLFIGDSTNRGMMYFLLERVNSSLQVWGRSHDLQVYEHLNQDRTLVSYSYYPRFWEDKDQRPTFRQSLLQLIHRSRPLVNSKQTVLVVGGTIREVLDRESLSDVLVVVKSLGMGFHLPVDGIRSLSLREIQDLYRQNQDILTAAKHHGYEAIDTFSITMGRFRDFLQGRCACHFHQVEKSSRPSDPITASRTTPELQSDAQHPEKEAWPRASTYHVRGPVNQVYSEILLSRLCPRNT